MTFAFGPRFLDNPIGRKYRDEATGGEGEGAGAGGGEGHWSDAVTDDGLKASLAGFESQDKVLEAIGYTPPATPDFPDDWRNKMVGDLPEDADDAAKEAHEKALKKLGRYQSPQDVWKSNQEAHKKISAGEINKPLGDNPTEQELKDYRAANNIPEAAEGYHEHLGDLNIGENEKPVIDAFLKDFAHPRNLSPDVVKDLIEWNTQNGQAQLAEFDRVNDEAKAETQAALQQEWQKEYGPNVTRINNLLAMGGSEFADRIASATLDNGVSLFNDQSTMKFLLKLASDIDPLPTSVGGQGANLDSITDRLTAIDKVMQTNRKAYNKDTKMQAEYVDLINAYTKLSDGKAWGQA